MIINTVGITLILFSIIYAVYSIKCGIPVLDCLSMAAYFSVIGFLFLLPNIILKLIAAKKENNKNVSHRENKVTHNRVNASKDETVPDKPLMLSQFPALYARDHDKQHKDYYIKKLCNLGVPKGDAEKLFDFESKIVKKYNKTYLLENDFTKSWFFNLSQKFFVDHPSEKDDIISEGFLTISELCKLIDEAEWHYWNSHEKEISPNVWFEITEWKLKGKGGEFAEKYLVSIAEKTGVSESSVAVYSNHEGDHLNKYKWNKALINT